jgi:hypothetical protein
MNKGVVIVLLLSVWIPIGTLVSRRYFEEWLYRCQSNNDRRYNDMRWAAIVDKNYFHKYGLPYPTDYYAKNAQIFHYPDSSCRIFYFHGRGRTIHFNYYLLGPLYQKSKCSIVAFEYPACEYDPASSNDGPDIILERATKLVDTVKEQDHLICSSMGCSILLTALSKLEESKHFKRLVLENPPTSLSEVASFPSFLLRALIGEKNDWRVPPVLKHQCKILVLTSEEDELVPKSMSYKLVEQYNKTHEVKHVILLGSNHGNAPSHPKYMESILDFIS